MMRRCCWPGCEAMVKPALWGCKKHWYMLPQVLRTRIWDTYRPGQEADSLGPSEAYYAAFREVQEWIRKNAPAEPAEPQGRLFR